MKRDGNVCPKHQDDLIQDTVGWWTFGLEISPLVIHKHFANLLMELVVILAVFLIISILNLVYISRIWGNVFLILADSIMAHGPIAEVGSNVRNEPYSLPQGFSWDTLDLSSPAVVSYLMLKSSISWTINLLYVGKFWHDDSSSSLSTSDKYCSLPNKSVNSTKIWNAGH